MHTLQSLHSLSACETKKENDSVKLLKRLDIYFVFLVTKRGNSSYRLFFLLDYFVQSRKRLVFSQRPLNKIAPVIERLSSRPLAIGLSFPLATAMLKSQAQTPEEETRVCASFFSPNCNRK